jgi:hypothetical protein
MPILHKSLLAGGATFVVTLLVCYFAITGWYELHHDPDMVMARLGAIFAGIVAAISLGALACALYYRFGRRSPDQY